MRFNLGAFPMQRRIPWRSFVACAVLLVWIACSGDGTSLGSASQLPIADIALTPPGTNDRQHDPAVVALVVDGVVLCSGALIAPDVVLTEEHCVTNGEAESCPNEAGTVITARDPASLQVLVGEGVTGGEPGSFARDIIVPNGSNICLPDVALVILGEPIYEARPLKVRSTGAATGDHVRTSGFVVGDGGAVKVVRDHVPIEVTSATQLRLEEACWSNPGNLALDESTGAIVGVESRAVGSACSGPHARNAYARTDARFDFIAHALEQAVAASTSTGQAREITGPVDLGSNCAHAADCAAGVCVSAGGRQYCSRMCAAHDRCPAKFRCLATSEGTPVCVQ